MAFPWDKEENFEDGTVGIFDGTETDTGARLNVRSYRDLWRLGRRVAPWRGAYCLEVDLGATAEASVIDPDGNLATDAETFIDFMLYVPPGLADAMTDGDEFTIFQLLATATSEGLIEINFSDANGLRIGIGETAGTAFASLLPGWHHVCLGIVIDLAAPTGDGSLELFLDDTSVATVTGLTQAAITDFKIGVIGQDNAYVGQFILFDAFREDSARFRAPKERFPEQFVITKSGHAFVGPGAIDNISLLSGAGTDCVVSVYDTDRAENFPDRLVAELHNTANNELIDPAGVPIRVQRGAYIEMSGVNPRALVKLGRCPFFSSDGVVMLRGAKVA